MPNLIEIELPNPLPYPKIFPFKEVNDLKGKYCYIIKSYPNNGISVTYYCNKSRVFLRLSDFSGKILDVENLGEWQESVETVMKEYVPRINPILSKIGIKKTALYFSNNRLVDVRWDFNKYASPGFIKDFFGKIIPTQEEINNPKTIDEEFYEILINGHNDYYGPLIIKPSNFKLIIRGDELIPMYGAIR